MKQTNEEHDAITNAKKLFILWNLPDLTMMMLLLLLLHRLQPTINNHIRHNCFLNHHLFCVYTICSGIWLSFLRITFQFDTFIRKKSSSMYWNYYLCQVVHDYIILNILKNHFLFNVLYVHLVVFIVFIWINHKHISIKFGINVERCQFIS